MLQATTSAALVCSRTTHVLPGSSSSSRRRTGHHLWASPPSRYDAVLSRDSMYSTEMFGIHSSFVLGQSSTPAVLLLALSTYW